MPSICHRFTGRLARTLLPLHLVAAVLLAPRAARADLFGGDVAALIAIGKQLYETHQQVQAQVRHAKSMIEFTKQSLKVVPPESFGDVLALHDHANATYNGLLSDVSTIGYNVESINQDFRKVFPSRQAVKNAKYSDYDGMYTSWHDQMQSTSEVAMRAQANSAKLEENALRTQQILNMSMGSDGQVQQMQAMIQMLAVIQQQLTTLTQTISAGERVTTGMAASSASEKIVEREKSRRLHEGFGKSYKPVRVPKRLPQPK